MSIQEKINADLKAAILSKDETKKSILRVLLGEFSRIPTDATKVISDDKAIITVKKMVENAKMILSTSGSNNPIVLDEIAILTEYLPKQLSEEELSVVIDSIISSTGYRDIKDMGKLMGELKRVSNNFDGKLASELIKSKLK